LSPRESCRITITGYLDHKVLSELLPLASLVIVPSKLAEAFGMIAVESMAAGVLPLCSHHSGLREVIEEVRLDLPDLGKNMILDPEKFFDDLPVRIVSALKFLFPNGFSDHHQRRHVAEILRQWAVKKYSWNSIGLRLLES
jgi:glycosyltransferase involved in cell wall biosynthesis